MSRFKAVFAAVILAAIMSVVPQAHAAPIVKVMIAGSSALWQTLALGAYNAGHCATGGVAPCKHYTGSTKFNLTDTRPTLLGGTNNNDPGSIWIVWDHSVATPHVWAYIKVDSVVGTRCYFAQPHCNVNISSFPAAGNLINSLVWGDGSSDSTPPAAVQAIFTATGVGCATIPNNCVNVAATDIRPEDGLFAACRTNATLGGGPDGLDGLGYGMNSPGVCPSFGAGIGQLVGNPILSGLSGSPANNLAFNISGTDPFSGTAIPVPTTVSVGAAPIIFVTSRSGALSTVTNGTDTQLKSVFSGGNCNASALGASGVIQAYLREPLSGTMNTTEYTVFRYPNEDGTSQETNVGSTNPLKGTPCSGGGGGRTRGIGTGDVVSGVFNSNANFGMDGIAYTFFSYGNVSSIASSASYGYLQLNGVDGIFASYAGGDPGEPGNGTVPGAKDLPASCAGAFPCPESAIWAGHRSFPHLRDGTYRAWSVLRVVSNGTALTNVKVLVNQSNRYVVTSTPDYVPFLAVKSGTTTLDPGLPKQRSHYGPGAVNTGLGEKGRDAGGCIQTKGSSVTQKVQEAPGHACSTFVPH